jgi:toxin ParE1/3/4
MIPRILPEAKAEILEAALWYENRRVGLGFDFEREVDRALERVVSVPLRFAHYEAALLQKPARRVRLKRFPYYLIFRFEEGDDAPLVIAVSHASRRPGYWADRG